MGFRENSYCTVWSVEPGKGNSTKVRLSTSRKNKDGEYETDFSGFCTFIGNAHAKSGQLKERDRIKLGGTDVTTWYSKEKDKEYVTYKVFDFEKADSANGTSAPAASAKTKPDFTEGETDDDLPF